MIKIELSNLDLVVKIIGSDYKIDIMNNGLSIGTLSGKNVSSGGGGTPPANTALPTISDTTPTVGQALTVTDGSWTNSPTSYSYQWSRDGVAISDGISSSYTVVSADYNLPLSCTVTANNSSGSVGATSANTSNVLPLAPVNTVIPNITGITTSGNTLTCSSGTWSSQATPSYTYQWTKDGIDIGGQTATTYAVQVADEDHYIGCDVIATSTGGVGAETSANDVYITDPSLSNITSNHIYSGSDRMLIYTPPGYSNDTNDYPLIFFYHGNGERGVPIDSSTSAGTGDGSTTGFSGSLSNTNKIIHSSVYVTVSGVQVGTGRFGVISGNGISGTYNYDDGSSASFSLTFSSAPANSAPIRIYFTQSNLLSQATFKYLNLGDEPGSISSFDNCIIACPQISRASGGFVSTEWDDALNYLVANYRINTNRIGVTGLSLGGDTCNYVLVNQNPGTTYSFASFICMSPGSNSDVPAGGDAAYANSTNKGKLYIRGTSDTNGATKVPSMMANCNGVDREFPVDTILYWGLGHSSATWDTKGYNRKDRTDATGTADIDYIKWLLRFSLDAEEQATLFVRYAEDTEKDEDYRLAVRQVSNLSSSATKTQLTTDLATLKATLGTWVVVDFGTSFYSTSGNYNNVTSAAVGTVVSNLINDTGSNTGYSITITAATDASPTMTADIGTLRVNGRQHGVELNTNRDGMRVDAVGTTGTITFGGLDNAQTYTLKVFVTASNNAWTNRAECQAVFGGSTKYLYCDDDTVTYIEFTGLSPSSNQIAGTIASRLTASTERLLYLQKMILKQE